MSVDFDLSEVSRLAADLGAAPVKTERTASQKLSEVAAELRDDARAGAPVDTGALRNSIVIVGGRDYRIVKATTDYAFFVEYGTSDTPPQPYMRPAASHAEERLTEAFAELGNPFD